MKQYIVDAFTDTLFHGNYAAVCILEKWPDDELMQNIATENNFAETAFAVKEADYYHLRWFTPVSEIDFCGHATLATAFVLFRFFEQLSRKIIFRTKAGELTVEHKDSLFVMDLPAYRCLSVTVTKEMEEAIGIRPVEAYKDRDLLLVLEDEALVRNLKPDFEKMKKLEGLTIAVTAPGKGEYDCVSRCFAPDLDIPEDPVTGSTHCMITPYWCNRLMKDSLTCYQASKRGGTLYTRRQGDRILILGKAVLFSVGELFV